MCPKKKRWVWRVVEKLGFHFLGVSYQYNGLNEERKIFFLSISNDPWDVAEGKYAEVRSKYEQNKYHEI